MAGSEGSSRHTTSLLCQAQQQSGISQSPHTPPTPSPTSHTAPPTREEDNADRLAKAVELQAAGAHCVHDRRVVHHSHRHALLPRPQLEVGVGGGAAAAAAAAGAGHEAARTGE